MNNPTTTTNPDALIRSAERFHHANPTVETAAAVEALKARYNPMVRVEGPFGFTSCEILGALIRQTKTGYSYKCATTGKTKNVKRTRKPTCAGMGKRTAHLLACTSCPDHIATTRGAGFCIHNRPNSETCETCLSM